MSGILTVIFFAAAGMCVYHSIKLTRETVKSEEVTIKRQNFTYGSALVSALIPIFNFLKGAGSADNSALLMSLQCIGTFAFWFTILHIVQVIGLYLNGHTITERLKIQFYTSF